MHERFVALYDRWVLSHPLATLGLVALALVALATQLGNIKLDASADALVLEGDEDLQFFRETSARYASQDFLLLTFQPPGDLLGDDSLATLAALRDDLAAIPGVSSVTTILDVPLLQSPPISIADIAASDQLPTLETPGVDRELVRREFRDSPIYAQLLVSEDGRTAAVQVNLQRDERYFALLNRRESLRGVDVPTPAQQQQLRAAERDFKAYSTLAADRQSALVEQVRAVAQRYRDRADIFVGGVPMIAADMVTFVRGDLVTFGSGILVFMVAMLSVIFRRLRWVLLPMLTCCGTVLFMLGLLAWLDWRMTVISSNFVAVLLTVGLAIAVHLVVRYRELHAEFPEAEQRELVLRTVRFMSIPCFYTTLTTAVAFVSLVVSGIRPVIDFGWMMTIGIAVALVLTFLVLPPALSLLPKGAPVAPGERGRGFTVAVGRFTERHGGAILLVSALVLATCLWGVSRLEVENRFIDYFKKSTEIYQGMELLDAELGGTIPLDVVVELDPKWTNFGQGVPAAKAPSPTSPSVSDDGFDAGFDDGFTDDFADDFAASGDSFQQSYWFTTRGMERIKAIHDYLDAQPETGKVLSLATTYAVVRQLLGNVSDVELAIVQQGLPDSIKALLVAPYYDEATQQVRISLRAKETSRDLRRDAFLSKVRQHLQQEMDLGANTLRLTNMLVLYNNVLQSLFQSQILTLGAVFLAIMAMFVALFRSLSLALLAVAPNMLAALMVLGAMGLVGIPLDIMTVTIAAIVVGIGVDNTIHYVHRFRREFPRDRNYLATMHRCHGSIGKAMYYTSVTIIVGFSILMLSNFNPSVYFGLLTGLAMLAALAGALLLLPRLILAFKPLGVDAGAGAGAGAGADAGAEADA